MSSVGWRNGLRYFKYDNVSQSKRQVGSIFGRSFAHGGAALRHGAVHGVLTNASLVTTAVVADNSDFEHESEVVTLVLWPIR